jgi:hypothetical protein
MLWAWEEGLSIFLLERRFINNQLLFLYNWGGKMKKRKLYFIYFNFLLLILICNYGYGFPEYKVLGSTFQTIGPMDTATFQIEVTNNYDLRTNFNFHMDSAPDGWSAVIMDSVLIDANSKKTVLLSVAPPDGFGFHHDTATFSVIVARESPIPTTLNFMVESSGFSTIGIEPILLVIILISCISVIAYLLFKKKSKIKVKNKRNK